MSSILKVKIPFKRRKTNGGTDGLATFYLDSVPAYLPTVGQTVVITHTDVPSTSGLKTKLNNILVSSSLVVSFIDMISQSLTNTPLIE